MSRTDKDVPYRVHVKRKGRETHDHRHGVCDFTPKERENYRIDAPGYRYRRTCGLEISGMHYWTSLRFYSRTKLVAFYASSLNDEDNARVRSTLVDIRKLHRAGEDIEFADVPNYQHRHSAEWEAW